MVLGVIVADLCCDSAMNSKSCELSVSLRLCGSPEVKARSGAARKAAESQDDITTTFVVRTTAQFSFAIN